jgi:hypothetical protein
MVFGILQREVVRQMLDLKILVLNLHHCVNVRSRSMALILNETRSHFVANPFAESAP